MNPAHLARSPNDDGAAAMRLLVGLRFRGWSRKTLRGLRQPKKLAMLLGGLGLLAFWIWIGTRSRSDGSFLNGEHGDVALGMILMFFPIVSLWAAARQGLISFSPEEVHFLFPGPVSTRTLLATHLITNSAKSVSGACFFAIFVRPGGVSFPWAALSFGVYLVFIVSLQALVDLRCIGMDDASRRRRALRILLGVLLVLGGGVALAAALSGDRGPQLLGWATLPMEPFVALIRQRGLGDAGVLPTALNAAGILIVIAAMFVAVLRFRGDVRESSHATSRKMQEKIRAMRRGALIKDAPKERTDGAVLPMLPRWGGAGVHAWRQLSVLRRTRKSFFMLVLLTLGMGVGFSVTGKAEPFAIAIMMLSVLSFAGPMYVQCDFRSDYESLAWMRTFPSPPGVLAAGQLLASAIVLYVLQLALGGWGVFVCPPELRLVLVGVLLVLPVFNMLQLSVWNGAHLIYPVRPVGKAGAPNITQMLRVYLNMLGVLATLAIALALSAGFGTLTWWLLDRVAGFGPTLAVRISTGLVGLATLCMITTLCVWCVGRLFVRVDPNADLGD